MSNPKRTWIAGVACAIALSSVAGVAAAANANYHFCYSPAFAGWRNFPEPCIDGVIGGACTGSCASTCIGGQEQGWSNGFRYVFNNGSGSGAADAVVLAIANGTAAAHTLHLTLGFQIKNDKTFDDEDLVVAAFQFASNKFGLIAVNPLTRTGAAPPNTGIKYFTSPDAVTWTEFDSPTWITSAATASGDAACMSGDIGNCRWDVEIKAMIEPTSTNPGTSAMPVPTGTYIGISRVYHTNHPGCEVDAGAGGAGGTICTDDPADEFAWPPVGPSGEDMLLYGIATNVKPPATWGASTFDTTSGCNGVFFGPSDISVTALTATNSAGHACPANQPRVGCNDKLQVNVHNSSINGATGAADIAHGVTLQFFHSPFGGSTFSGFTATGPASAPVDIPASSGGTPLSVNWTPTDASTHECLLAKIDSAVGGTTIINGGEFVNAAVVGLSTATVEPFLSVKGLPAAATPTPRVRLTSQTELQYAYAEGAADELPLGKLTSQMSWRFSVAQDTGKTITIKGKRFRVMRPFAGYRIAFQHPLAVDFATTFENRHVTLIQKYQNPSTTIGGGPTTTTGGTTTTTGNLPGGGTTGPTTGTVRANGLAATNTGGGTIGDPIGGDGPVSKGLALSSFRALNTDLANDSERPAATDFSKELKGATPVANSAAGSNPIFDVDLPASGETTVSTNATFGTSGTTPPPGCPGCATTSTATKVASLGFMVLGVLMAKRRRRR